MSNEEMRWLLKVLQPARTLASLPERLGPSDLHDDSDWSTHR